MSTTIKKQRAIYLLAEEINKNRLIIFVGAGCSISAGLPSWKEMIEDLLKKYSIPTEDTNLIRLASRLEREIGVLKFREEVADRLRTSYNVIPSIYDFLVPVNINLFITTNYDHLLEDSFRKNGYSPIVIVDDKDLPSINPIKKTIVKLHGDIDSPVSMVISSLDYAKYKTKRRGFVEYLNTVMSQNSVLLLGTSFDDPRLKEVDDHILDLFGEYQKQSFIIFKRPEKEEALSEENFKIKLEDFKALCEDFRDRGFFVIVVNKYEEIASILRELNIESIKKQAESDIRFKKKTILQSDYSDMLEKSLLSLLDQKTIELAEFVRGEGRLPTSLVMKERAIKLLKHLENPPFPLNPETQMEGYLTVSDAFINSYESEYILKARQYYEKATIVFRNMTNQEPWKERLMRVRAKLLAFEGKISEAVESISQSADNKSRSLWLALMIDSKRFQEAYDFISKHKISTQWVCEALCIYIYSGHLQEADELFRRTVDEYYSLKKENKLKDSPYKGTFFYEKICYVMADAFYQRAIRLARKGDFLPVFLGELTKEGEGLCKKSLNFIDKVFQQTSRKNLGENYIAYLAVLVEMRTAYLLKKWGRSDRAAREAASVKPIHREVIDYLILRAANFGHNFLRIIVQRLAKEHPKQVWSFLAISVLEGSFFKNDEKSLEALKKAIGLAVTTKEKREVANVAFDIGLFTNRLDEVFAVTREILPQDDLRRKFLEAHYLYLTKGLDAAEKIFKEIESKKPSFDIAAQINSLRADIAIKEEKWEEAKELLQKSIELFAHPLSLKRLLYVLTKIQDDTEALKISERMDSMGIEDPQVILVKAQAARNLGLFKKAKKAWTELRKKFPDRPEYSFGLAETLWFMDSPEKALRELGPFIKCDKKLNHNCLMLACDIYISKEEYDKAFQLLKSCQTRIQDNPALLMKYMDLGFKVGYEKDANEAFKRLLILKQEGKVPDEFFSAKSLDELIEMMKKHQESLDKINRKYLVGQFPRMLICEFENMPLYLDWAVRTRELQHPIDPRDWVNFTTYSSNSLRIEFEKEEKNRFALISVPKKLKEIVIDYHALITLHQLGILKELGRKFSKVYYPQILKIVLADDQEKFHHHQLSKEKVLMSINNKLSIGKIREILAPEPKNNKEKKEDTYIKRNLRLSELERIPLVDSYVQKKELHGYPKAFVIRLSQLIDWLYQKGKISKIQSTEMKTKVGGESPIHTDNVFRKINEEGRIIVEEMAIESIQQFGLIETLLDSGILIMMEKATADKFRHAVLGLNFRDKIGKCHRDLANSVKQLNFFHPTDHKITRRNKQSLYFETFLSSIEYAKENNLYLLTDDRCTQMIRLPGLFDRQFGTDILIENMYNQDVIDIKKYADSFLKLCKWRYRFLLPHPQILAFFAKQFRNNPLGLPLTLIAAYGRQCMEDPGLFLGLEPTDPPLPLGVKFYMAWIDRWIEFLILIWNDEEFSEDNLIDVTRKVYTHCLPDPPKGIKYDIRKNLETIIEKNVIMQIFLNGINLKDSSVLHGLLTQTYETFGYSEEKKIETLRNYLEFIKENQKRPNKDLLNAIASKLLFLFFGKNIATIDPPVSLLPILQEFGVDSRHGLKFKPGLIFSEGDIAELFRKDIPEYVDGGPIIFAKLDHEQKTFLTTPHDLIYSSQREIRQKTAIDLMASTYISKFTKEEIEKRLESVISGDTFVWLPASREISDILLKDFFYTNSLFKQSLFLPSEEGELVNLAWKHVLAPNIKTVLDNTSLLIKASLKEDSIDSIEQLIKKGIIEDVMAENKSHQDLVINTLNWYLSNIYFLPVAPPLNPWRLISHTLHHFVSSEKIEIRQTDILESVKKWRKKNEEDPLASLMSLEIVLNARGLAKKDEQYAFTNDEFYLLLDDLFKAILYTEESTPIGDFELIHSLWQMRKYLARYYLKFMDLNNNLNIEDENKVALAWWMAREVSSSILNSLKNLKTEDKISVLKAKTSSVIKYQLDLISFSHLFTERAEFISVSRFHTFEGKAPLATALLAMIMPHKSRDPKEITPFNGLIKPVNALSPEIRDFILKRLAFLTFSGEGQLAKDHKFKIPQYWSTSFCISSPVFFKKYYTDSIAFLGEEKLGMIKSAEYASNTDFLRTELNNLQTYFDENRGVDAALILNSLKALVFSHGKMPKSANVFRENKNLTESITKLEDKFQTICFFALIQTLRKLLSMSDFEWTDVFENFFQYIDYTKCSPLMVENIVPEVVSVVLIGANYKVLNPIFNLKTSDKRIRSVLGKIKSNLEYAFPRVPSSNREIIRKILNDLETIPSIS